MLHTVVKLVKFMNMMVLWKDATWVFPVPALLGSEISTTTSEELRHDPGLEPRFNLSSGTGSGRNLFWDGAGGLPSQQLPAFADYGCPSP